MTSSLTRPKRQLRLFLQAAGLISLLAGCTPRITPQQLENEFRRDVPQNASVRQVEEFFSSNARSVTAAALSSAPARCTRLSAA